MDTHNSRDNSAKSNRLLIPSFKTGWRKRQFKSHRKSDNEDNNNHETMIHEQSYGAGGPCENLMVNQTESKTHCRKTLHAKRKRRQDVQDDEEATFGQQPAKNPKLGSSDFENLAISGLIRAMANLTPVTTKPVSSFRTSSRKRQFTSSCQSDDDDDSHETIVKIRQRFGEACENMMVKQTESESHFSIAVKAKRKRCQIDQSDEEETTFRQQAAKKTDCLFLLKKEFIFLPAFGLWSIRVSVASLACFFYLTFFRQKYLESVLLKPNLRPFYPPNSDNV